ncbi:hypothetical protein PR202_ga14410 [Eleusine coracana subsp. coracana]|uniref:Uncharacterized protein n=1 Tax=Eleusine coracana subsp. coracana TaxID=191504 RepID=A0AAV5CHB7_ELECO|nr:hypothetical protein PR202_ga14410 [Eleusine coracana subsp. coracana]
MDAQHGEHQHRALLVDPEHVVLPSSDTRVLDPMAKQWEGSLAGSGRDNRREEMRGNSPVRVEAGELAGARRGGELEGLAGPRRCVEV